MSEQHAKLNTRTAPKHKAERRRFLIEIKRYVRAEGLTWARRVGKSVYLVN
jgi:hypothetical protein